MKPRGARAKSGQGLFGDPVPDEGQRSARIKDQDVEQSGRVLVGVVLARNEAVTGSLDLMTADSNNLPPPRQKMASSTALSCHDRHRSLITTIMIETTRKWTR